MQWQYNNTEYDGRAISVAHSKRMSIIHGPKGKTRKQSKEKKNQIIRKKNITMEKIYHRRFATHNAHKYLLLVLVCECVPDVCVRLHRVSGSSVVCCCCCGCCEMRCVLLCAVGAMRPSHKSLFRLPVCISLHCVCLLPFVCFWVHSACPFCWSAQQQTSEILVVHSTSQKSKAFEHWGNFDAYHTRPLYARRVTYLVHSLGSLFFFIFYLWRKISPFALYIHIYILIAFWFIEKWWDKQREKEREMKKRSKRSRIGKMACTQTLQHVSPYHCLPTDGLLIGRDENKISENNEDKNRKIWQEMKKNSHHLYYIKQTIPLYDILTR